MHWEKLFYYKADLNNIKGKREKPWESYKCIWRVLLTGKENTVGVPSFETIKRHSENRCFFILPCSYRKILRWEMSKKEREKKGEEKYSGSIFFDRK